jgi:hypothetical protein
LVTHTEALKHRALLGHRLKAVRLQRRMSLRAVAEQAGARRR